MFLRWPASAAVVVLLGACSSGATSDQSLTPRVESHDARLEGALLTRADLLDLGFPGDTREEQLEDAAVYENPDPRGPCGAPLDQPDLADGATHIFSSSAAIVTSTVIELRTTRAQRYLQELAADSVPGCPPFTSTTNTGATQHVTPHYASPVALGDDAAIGTARIAVDGGSMETALVAVRRGRVVALAMAVAPRPVTEAQAQDLAEAVDRALQRLERTTA